MHVARTADLPGDVLVLVEYPQGSNEVPLIKVYQWDPDLIADHGGADGDLNTDEKGRDIGPLEMIYNSAIDSTEPAECDGEGNKLACAITNHEDGVSDVLWEYTSKDGTAYFPFETFYEGGINITQLLGGKNLCVSSFLAETRASRSEDAILKATGERTRCFRGPGFSWSNDLLEVLEKRDYIFDASILPSYISPLMRMYYFWMR